jgi:septation ring formation regulator EzrA
MESTKDLSEQDLLAKLSVLHERLVSFYAILSDLECEEARSVVQTQINNYSSTVDLFEKELERRNAISR